MENAGKENFELAMLDDYVVLYTGSRIDRNTVPEKLFCYDVRHDDDCQGIACEVKPYVLVNHKYYRTKSIEESVEWAKKVQARKAGFVLWGRQYDTLNDIAKAFGLNTGSLRVRIAGGKALAETVSEMLEKDTILFRGREYAGIASLAAAYGHDSALISDRLIYGMTLERALSQPIRRMDRPEFAIEYDGKT